MREIWRQICYREEEKERQTKRRNSYSAAAAGPAYGTILYQPRSSEKRLPERQQRTQEEPAPGCAGQTGSAQPGDSGTQTHTLSAAHRAAASTTIPLVLL